MPTWAATPEDVARNGEIARRDPPSSVFELPAAKVVEPPTRVAAD
jgi:hypothetical protein